ncbi:MAG TPA: hypothetical protein VNA28_02370 [Solirubrobacteraceae bacterium]|nr:hypothetical protein [Solirubrobacteraceae bacterium]
MALLAGCGGDDDTSSSGEDRLTKAEYTTQANKVCSDIAEEQTEYEDRIDNLDRGDLKAAAPIIEEVLEKTRAGFDRLKALSPPHSEREKVAAYLQSVERLLASRDKLTEAARNDDSAAGEKASEEGDKLDAEQEGLADRLALNDCDNVF